MEWKVPLFEVHIGDEEIDAVTRVLRSRWLTMGAVTQEFEAAFASFLGGAPHALAVNNCTAALHMACVALGLGGGDEVICPSLTFVATANAVRYAGAKPVFADVHSFEDWNVSAETIAPLINERTRAIMVMHYAGFPCDMPSICALARERGLAVIEDCAHSPGSYIDGRATGLWGDVSCFSFFSNKNLTTGEGGMIVTARDDVAARLRLLRSHGMTTLTLERHKGHAFSYDVVDLGYNYRTTDLNAALGVEQLKKLPAWNLRRSELVQLYRQLLRRVDGLTVPFDVHRFRPVWHIMPVLLPRDVDREGVMAAMRDRGVQTSIHYRPVHTFTAYARLHSDELRKTEEIGRRELTLPLYPSMADDGVAYVVDTLQNCLRSGH
jgi:dTDP-4-amino-4,6-dideoxygalactose transaminase